jgi:serine/threonine protein kinase
VLYQLGSHDQIPRLLAHFEDQQEFYLAQEFIEGISLIKELKEGKPWSEAQTIGLMKDILHVLKFVHQQQVIHRDLKPSNLIRRKSDHKIVLIDFGAVKQVSTQNYDVQTGLTNLTISIGTQGYMPNEQLAGKPRFSSDIYAVGMMGIQALTGIHPKHLSDDDTGELDWRHRAPHANPALMDVLDHMVRYDFRDRYPTAVEALNALEKLPIASDVVPPPRPSLHPEEDAVATGTYEHEEDDTYHTMSDEALSVTDLGQPSPEGASTALWMPSQSPDLSTMHGTSLTQAIAGRPHAWQTPPDSTEITVIKRRQALRSKLLLAAAMIITAAAAPIVIPNLLSQSTLFRSTGDPDTRSPEASPTGPALSSTNFTELFAYANQLMTQKQFSTALRYYDRTIELKADDAEAYAGRCEALNQLRRPEEAMVSCNDALAYDPNSVEARWSKGNALLQQDRTYEALKIYEEVTDYDAKFAPGWVKRGVALQKLGRSAEALYVLDQAIILKRDSAEAWSTKGEALLNLQRYDEAITALDKALQLQNPDDPETVALREKARKLLGQ